MKPRRIDILGTPVDCVTMADALAFADEMTADGRPHSIVAVNPEKVMRAQTDPALLDRLKAADLLIPDGIGVVIAAKLLHHASLERVPGAELMPLLCAQAAAHRQSVFLYGAKPDVVDRAAVALVRTYPGLHVAGTQHGFLPDGQMPALIKRINASGATMLFVALGSPRQEEWIMQHLPTLTVSIIQGVGGTFDVLAGTAQRAPALWRTCHLEWLYRLLSNPARAPRQIALPLFAFGVLRYRLLGR